MIVTILRPQNTDDKHQLEMIMKGLSELDRYVIFPMHPRSKQSVERIGINLKDNNLETDPVVVGLIDIFNIVYKLLDSINKCNFEG